MNDLTPALKALHQAYVTATGLKLEFTFQRLHAWELWKARGWCHADLLLVVTFLRQGIKDGRKWGSSLNFRSLIENMDAFEEHLAEARARGRIPKMDPGKREVLRATARLEPIKSRPRSVEQVMRDETAFRQFKEWRTQNGF